MKKLEEDFKLLRYGLSVRLVNEKDAEFILSLRTDQKLSRYLNSTKNDTLTQINWIREYKYRQNKGIEYYFIFLEDNKPVGLCRIYNVNTTSFTTGSWIFKDTKHPNSSIFGSIITREIAFDLFPGKELHFDVRKENKKVLAYHKLFKPELISEDDENYYFKLSQEKFENGRCKLLDILWPS
jgi:hypothetical protein